MTGTSYVTCYAKNGIASIQVLDSDTAIGGPLPEAVKGTRWELESITVDTVTLKVAPPAEFGTGFHKGGDHTPGQRLQTSARRRAIVRASPLLGRTCLIRRIDYHNDRIVFHLSSSSAAVTRQGAGPRPMPVEEHPTVAEMLADWDPALSPPPPIPIGQQEPAAVDVTMPGYHPTDLDFEVAVRMVNRYKKEHQGEVALEVKDSFLRPTTMREMALLD